MSILKLRKRLYRNNGSVLFIVLAVMSMMIILATATMYVVFNQNASIEVHYAGEQAFQTGTSLMHTVSDAIGKQIDDIGRAATLLDVEAVKKLKDTLGGKMLLLEEGKKLVSDNSAFNDALKASGLGDSAVITIENMKEETSEDSPGVKTKYFKITVEVTANGETSSISQIRKIDVGVTEPTKPFLRFLTSTGYEGQVTSIKSKDIYGDAFFENTNTVISGSAQFHKSMYSSGNLTFDGVVYSQLDPEEYNEFVVKKDFEISAGNIVDKIPYIFVGGDLNCKTGIGNDVKAIYVKGDLTTSQAFDTSCKFYINGDLNANSKISGTFYVNGNVHITDGFQKSDNAKICFLNGSGSIVDDRTWPDSNNGMSVYHPGDTCVKVDGKSELQELNEANAFKNSNPFVGINSWTDVDNYIDKQTQPSARYETWHAEEYFNDNITSAESISFGSSGTVFNTNKQFVSLSASSTGDPKVLNVDASANDVYIYLNPNDTGSDGKPLFTMPQGSVISYTGSHSVILVLPENASFKAPSSGFIGNLNLLKVALDKGDDYTVSTSVGNGLTYGTGQRIDAATVNNDESVTYTFDDGKTVTMQKGADGLRSLNTYLDTGAAPGASNNLYLVSKGKTNIDLNGGNGFFGYVYAPSCSMNVAGGGECVLAGGILVSDYQYENSSAQLDFIRPYDYGNAYCSEKCTACNKTHSREEVVEHLMNIANKDHKDSDPADIPAEFKVANPMVIGYE